MEIELSEDLQHYKESFIMGLTVKQAFFSILALGTGTAIVLLLHHRIGVTLSCYVATPFVVPLALTGFYHYHGLTFWQFAGKMVHFAFFNRPLLYWSTESMQELEQIASEERQEEEKERSRKAGLKKESVEERQKKEIREHNAETGIKKKKKHKGETKRAGTDQGQAQKSRVSRKRKRRGNKDMVTVVKKRKPAGLVAVMLVGWILTLTALLAAGAAMAAVWYGQYR